MFNGLKIIDNNVTSTPKPLARTGISLKTLRASQKQSQVTARIEKSLMIGRNLTSDFADLRRLTTVLKTYGISKPLMQFVNPANSVISKFVKNIPSNESLDLISNVDDHRTKSAIEGLEETLASEPQRVSEWAHASAEDIEDLLECTEDQLKDIGEAISHALLTLEDGDFNSDELDNTTVTAVSSDVATARIDALLNILPDMDAVVSDPTNRDAIDIYKEKIAGMIQSIGPYVGIAIDPNSPYLIVASQIPEENMPHEATLSSLGYTRDIIIELLKKADNLIDELNGLIERKEEIIAHLHDTADTIAQVDNDVPPAVDGAINADNIDPDQDVDNGVTQADVYHYQISSHLYTLTVILGVSVGVVEEILDLVDDDGDEDMTVVEVTEE